MIQLQIFIFKIMDTSGTLTERPQQTTSFADASAVDSTKQIAREGVVEITHVGCTLMKII